MEEQEEAKGEGGGERRGEIGLGGEVRAGGVRQSEGDRMVLSSYWTKFPWAFSFPKCRIPSQRIILSLHVQLVFLLRIKLF